MSSSNGLPRATTQAGHGHHRGHLAALSLGALGVVYGDIGTSPLYAIKECAHHMMHAAKQADGHFNEKAALAALDPATLYGIMSLAFWALVLVICIKYATFVLRADNNGEGGILSLGALVMQTKRHMERVRQTRLALPITLALFGTGLLFFDGMITPAISVLGAVEGLSVATSAFDRFVVPITVGILVALFLAQRFGTHRIGAVFGWIMLAWFVSIAAAALPAILREPKVFEAINPIYAWRALATHGWTGFLLLGAVVLVVTGGEALYADLGHFGARPIRLAWFVVVLPAVVISYFGQGALILHSAQRGVLVENPFYALVQGTVFLYPMVVLATMAAIVASQALISGVFSMTKQAMLLGFSPRVTVVQTSADARGQIYIPEMNYFMMLGCAMFVVMFQTSSALAAAYGIAVTGTMAITSVLYFMLVRDRKEWGKAAWLFLVVFLLIDLVFLAANLNKLRSGGYIPVVGSIAVFLVMTTWWRGRVVLSKAQADATMPDEMFLQDVVDVRIPRVKGTAVFLAAGAEGIPQVLLHHVKHNKVLHERVVLLSITTEPAPYVAGNRSIEVHEMGQGFYRIMAKVGFMQTPKVPRIIARAMQHADLEWVESDTTYYLGRQTLVLASKSELSRWRRVLFSFLSKNAPPPTAYFDLPPNRVVELGMQVEI